ncbi:aminotransferase class IV [Clostridium sp. UBA3061]|uniref:aminotransferase class IV n=1 Tax=Clostridium sp. UBA3061 TaxID=1946353 RepID=UPI003218024E
MNIPYTVQDLCDITVEVLRKNEFKTTAYIRPLAYKSSINVAPSLSDNDNSFLLYAMPLGSFTGKDELHTCITSWKRLNSNMLPTRTKATAAYMNSGLASLEAVQNGFDEAIFLTDNDHICEGPGENLFCVKNGKLITPPPSDNILEGITRATVIEIAKKEFGMKLRKSAYQEQKSTQWMKHSLHVPQWKLQL